MTDDFLFISLESRSLDGEQLLLVQKKIPKSCKSLANS